MEKRGGRKKAQARLIYVHEGVEKYPRRQLKNVKYFTTVNKKPEEFWLEVFDYIKAHLVLDCLNEALNRGLEKPRQKSEVLVDNSVLPHLFRTFKIFIGSCLELAHENHS